MNLSISPANQNHRTAYSTSVQLHPFADMQYLTRVIAHLSAVRKEQGISLRRLSRWTQIREETLAKAERTGAIPRTRDFKAWAGALGLSWEQVWSLTFPAGR